MQAQTGKKKEAAKLLEDAEAAAKSVDRAESRAYALLAVATTSAVVMASRAERSALRHAEASLLVPALYAAQRLRPDDLLEAPRGWRLQKTSLVTPLPDGTLREWHHLILAAANHEIRPVALDILDDLP